MVESYDARILRNGQRIVSDTLLFMCKIRVLAMSILYPSHIRAIYGHHRLKGMPISVISMSS
jgi:hypothetical protein